MSLKQNIKDFLKRILFNEDHPYFMMMRLANWKKKMMRMTYSEIEAAISKQYMETFGRPLNWDNPQTYNEKMQVSKLYMPTPEKTRLTDKYAVREWTAEKIGSEYLIPLLGVYDSFDKIDFDALPDQFVIKCNHDSGSYTIVRDKSKIDRKALKLKYDRHMMMNYAFMTWDMHYKNIKPKIIIEQYLGDAINEYKFYCFGGKPYYCFTTFGSRGINLTISFYDMDWQLQPFTRPDHKAHTEVAPRPAKYDELKPIVSKLCEGFGHVRVDMYVVGGRIYAGEMTFTTCSGWGKLSPDEWDYKLGALWPFDSSVRSQVLAHSSRP